MVRSFYSPRVLKSEGSIVRKVVVPKIQLSESVIGVPMFRRDYSPMAYSSNGLYSEDSIVRKCLFRRLDIPKVL